MKSSKSYKAFVGRFLTRGAVAVSVGLTTVAPSSAASGSSDGTPARLFADRLSTIRSIVSEHVEEQKLQLAQAFPHPPPPPPRPFANWDNAKPFSNFDNKHPFSNFGKAPIKPSAASAPPSSTVHTAAFKGTSKTGSKKGVTKASAKGSHKASTKPSN